MIAAALHLNTTFTNNQFSSSRNLPIIRRRHFTLLLAYCRPCHRKKINGTDMFGSAKFRFYHKKKTASDISGINNNLALRTWIEIWAVKIAILSMPTNDKPNPHMYYDKKLYVKSQNNSQYIFLQGQLLLFRLNKTEEAWRLGYWAINNFGA